MLSSIIKKRIKIYFKIIKKNLIKYTFYLIKILKKIQINYFKYSINL